ncbi:MAG TPA: hypothetical protein VJ570_05970 [Holophagaceae bacterium]|nr:hypothetical protein [Holophagaceae bacterium]
MNKSLIWALAAGLLIVGGGLLLARRGVAVAAQEEEAPLFRSQPQGAGRLIQLDAREPLRAVRWLPPLPGGWALCQVSTQADRQLLGLFQDGALVRTFPLPRPEGVTDGFFRQAEVREAHLSGSTLVLLLTPEGGRREASMVVALELDGTLKWARRVPAAHLSGDPSATWAWGPASAQLLPADAKTALPEAVAFPSEIAGPVALQAAGKGFLLAHAKGLSAWQGAGGWVHVPAPTRSPLGFPEAGAALVRCGDGFYWQPEPGTLLKVNPEARGVAPVPIPAPAEALDASLLKLLGSDDSGHLWFALARPSLPQAAPPTVPPPAPQVDPTEPAPPTELPAPALTADQRTAFEARLKGPMDRLYAWKPGEGTLRTFTWSQAWPHLGAPADLPIPTGDGGIRPEGKGWLGGDEAKRWWLPLSALP